MLFNAVFCTSSQYQTHFMVFLALVTLVWPHLPTKEVSGASISLRLAQRSLQYWTMPRNLWRPLTSFGGVIVRIACTLFGCGFKSVLVRIYPRYSISTIQNFDLGAFTLKPTSHNLVNSNLKCCRWSSRLALLMYSLSS